MAGLFDKQAQFYSDARPTYPGEWFTMLAQHSLALGCFRQTLGSKEEMFYSIANRVLKKPGGIIAVWGYTLMSVNPEFDPKMMSFLDLTLPYWHPNVKFLFDGYKTLPFPFDSVGLGSESEPTPFDIQKEISFEGFLGWLKSWSAINSAKEKGEGLLTEKMVKEFEIAWGGPKLVRCVVYKAFMLVGKVKL